MQGDALFQRTTLTCRCKAGCTEQHCCYGDDGESAGHQRLCSRRATRMGQLAHDMTVW
jgi:hypothetical protein